MIRVKIRQWLRKLGDCLDEKGLGLIESVVAVSIIGAVVIAFASALSTGSIATRVGEQAATSQRLALGQLEHIKSCAYDTDYSTIDTPEGYTIAVGVTGTPDKNNNIQKITVTIFREGENILIVEDYKVNR